MVKSTQVNPFKYLLALSLIIFIFFIPFFVNPSYVALKDNDLGRTYVPLFSFIKNSVFQQKQIPLWRPDQMMGESIIGNPLSSLVYPLNGIFLVLPIDFASVLFLFVHFATAAIGTFFLAKSYKFSNLNALSAAIFYALSTKMLVHMEAGHITMVAAISFLPLVYLSIRKIQKELTVKWLTLGAVSFSAMYLNYPTIAYYTGIFICLYWIFFEVPYAFNSRKRFKNITKIIFPPILFFTISAGLLAIVLLPHLEFAPLSTRSLLAIEDVAQPLWNFKKFLSSITFPYKQLATIDHEAFLYLGFAPTVAALYGFFKLKKYNKIVLAFLGIITVLFVLGLSTPLFRLMYEYLPLLKYSRVETRGWFIVALVVALTAAYGFEKVKKPKITICLTVLFLLEIFFISYKRNSTIPNLSFSNDQMYQTIFRDKDLFRVYCTGSCFNPQLIQKYNLQTLHGETPIQLTRFVNFLEKAGNYNWKNFTVIFPPYQIWQVENPPQPNLEKLSQANVKYIASPFQVTNPQAQFIGKFENTFLYENKKFLKRAYFLDSNDEVVIEKYTPNYIKLKFEPKDEKRSIIFSENFYPGWKTYQKNHNLPVDVYESVFRKITVLPRTDSIELKYQPKTLLIGKLITLTTIVLLLVFILNKRGKSHGKNRNS